LIIAVSDVHLGYGRSNREAFMTFLDDVGRSMGRSDHFVLLGDIFDFWRRNNVAVVLENEDTVGKIEDLAASVHYVPGNHDFTFASLVASGTGAFNIQKNLTLEEDGARFAFLHGYQLEVLANLEPLTIEEYEQLCVSLCQRTGDFIGDLLSFLWDSLHLSFKRGDKRRDMVQSVVAIPEKRKDMHKVDRLAKSRAKNLFLGLNKEDRFVFGHTHRPFLEGTVANTGCWVSDASEQNTYLKVESGEMQLLRYRG
jgi:UDP-2,3-diacylglucosamine pyrophosphatase LpxH